MILKVSFSANLLIIHEGKTKEVGNVILIIITLGKLLP